MADDNGNVTDINKKRAENKKDKAKKEPRPTFAEICSIYAKVLSDPLAYIRFGLAEPILERFHVIEQDDGNRELLREGPEQVCHYVATRALAAAIVRYGEHVCAGIFPDLQLTTKRALECAEYFLDISTPITEPARVLWKDQPGLTFHRLPWAYADYEPDGTPIDCPTWNQMALRVPKNWEAFCVFVGSLLVPESDRQQYCYLFGQGGDGKSAIVRWLAKVLGGAFASTQPPAKGGDKFWNQCVVGKRLLVFPDCNMSTYTNSGEFKTLTGGDPIKIERKYGREFHYFPNIKSLWVTNETPSASSEIADIRRIIYIEFTPRSPHEMNDPKFESKLWQEGGSFLAYCLALYREKCPDHGSIPVDNSLLTGYVEENEQEFQSAFDARLVYIGVDTSQKLDWLLAGSLWEVVADAFKERYQQRAFLTWIGRKYGVRRTRVSHLDRREWRYPGLVAKHY